MSKKPMTLRKFMSKNYGQIILHFVFILIALCYILPLMITISTSFTDEDALKDPELGFGVIPSKFSTVAYEQIFKKPEQIINGYKTTIAFSALATALHLFTIGLFAYPLSRNHFIFRKPLNFLILIMMLFSAGSVPGYVVNTQYLGLYDNFWIYVLPAAFSAYNCILVRTNYKAVPAELLESARIDGASELRICFSIVIPLSKATLASVGFLFLVGKWNDWSTCQVYIRDMELYSLQYLLQRILMDAQFIKQMIESGEMNEAQVTLPTESLRYAMAVVAAGPMMFVFPFFQKYFAKGMTLGSVKG